MSIKKPAAGISVFALVMLICVSIDSIRNLPATALFGSSLIFFFIFSALVFLIPTALVSAELSASWDKESGIYHWVRIAFGEKLGFIAIWLQWINTMVWYPTILSFLAATAAMLINPALAQNKIYLVSIILGTFWTLTLVNLKGIHTSARFASFCAITGLIIPMAFIVALALIWVFLNKPLEIQLHWSTLIPSFGVSDNWISLTAIMTSFLGMELAAVHVRDIANPQKNFPKALFFSSLFILFTMIGGSLAIAIVIPANKINLVNGVLEAFANFLAAYHISWLLPILTVMILIGTLGGVINWLISPAKGLLQAGKLGYLPQFLQKENKHGVARNILIVQAILVSVICLAFLLMPSVNGSYWLLTALSTQLYMLMYVLLFIAALRMHHKFPNQPKPFKIPGGTFGKWLVCLAGLGGCFITLAVGFFPPSGINVGGFWHYEMIFSAGLVGLIIPAYYFCYKKHHIHQLPAQTEMDM